LDARVVNPGSRQQVPEAAAAAGSGGRGGRHAEDVSLPVRRLQPGVRRHQQLPGKRPGRQTQRRVGLTPTPPFGGEATDF